MPNADHWAAAGIWALKHIMVSAFAGAPAAMRLREDELLARADLVLTGGQSLYEAKRHRHRNVHAFPSSVDVDHFAHARGELAERLGTSGRESESKR